MDYKKKYKEALEWARKVIHGKIGFVLDDVLEKFPELKESEDERIRENIIATIHLYYGEPLEDEAKEMIAWLEKQSEQKPAWSEEDEIALDDALWCCKQAASIAKDENDMGNIWYADNWLKSLKDKYSWKPSNEQMEALDDFIYAKYPNIEKHGALVKSLYQDLQKLKG